MASSINLLLSLLVFTASVVRGNWPSRDYNPLRNSANSPPQQSTSLDRYLTLPWFEYVSQPRPNQLPVGGKSEDDSTADGNTAGDMDRSVMCADDESRRWFCKELSVTELLGYGTRPNTAAAFDAYATGNQMAMALPPPQKRITGRTTVSHCDCRKRSDSVQENAVVYLGADHYPQYLPRNVSCDQSLCSQALVCQPTKYEVQVLVKRRTNNEEMGKHAFDDQLPAEVRGCWRTKLYTVFTDCMCTYAADATKENKYF